MFGKKNYPQMIIDLMALDIKGLTESVEKLEKSNKRLEKRLDDLNCQHENRIVRANYCFDTFETHCIECDAILSKVNVEGTTREKEEIKIHKHMIKLLEAKEKAQTKGTKK